MSENDFEFNRSKRSDEVSSMGRATDMSMRTYVKPLVRIIDLSKTIGENRIIKNFSLDIMPGEVMCLLGNNGSGKTTLINLLTGLTNPDVSSGDTGIRVN